MAKRKMQYGNAAGENAGAITPGSIGAFDLGTGTPLAPGMDLDELKDPGSWYSENGTASAALSNAPQTNYGFKLIVMAPAPDQTIQLAITNVGACTLYLRRWNGTSWATWRTIATAQ